MPNVAEHPELLGPPDQSPAGLEYELLEPIWERQPKESARAFAAFCAYRDAGSTRRFPRSLVDSYKRWRWAERARAYDAEIDRNLRLALQEEREAAARRHARLGRELQERSLERMRKLDLATLNPAAVADWIDKGVKIERQALGESTEKIEVDLKAQQAFVTTIYEVLVLPLVKTEEDEVFVEETLARLLGEGQRD